MSSNREQESSPERVVVMDYSDDEANSTRNDTIQQREDKSGSFSPLKVLGQQSPKEINKQRRTSSLNQNLLQQHEQRLMNHAQGNQQQTQTQDLRLSFPPINDDEAASQQCYKEPQYNSLQIDQVSQGGPRSFVDPMREYTSAVNTNNLKLGLMQHRPLMASTRDLDDHFSQQSFFSRVLDDIHHYRSTTRMHNEENIDLVSQSIKNADGVTPVSNGQLMTNDDDFHMEAQVVSEHTLKAWDFYLYIIGMLVRIQTIVLGYILFAVETDVTCVAVYESNQPVPRDMLPVNLNKLPGGFANMSRVFQTIIMMLFITSICTSIMYINKVVNVIKYHRSSREIYEAMALPAVRKYKIWNSIFGLSHLACCTIFMTHAGRVCSGWQVGNLPEEEKENLDRSLYLFARGGYFVVASVFGLCNLIGFLIVGKNAIN